MAFEIQARGEASDDDVRAAFGELVRTLRAIGDGVTASLFTTHATYSEADVPDEDVADDDSTSEELQP